jgi:acyl carrier protein
MEKLTSKLSEIFEVENIDINLKFSELEEWDSLTRLTLIAMLDSDYNLNLTDKDLIKFENIKEFCDYVINNRR